MATLNKNIFTVLSKNNQATRVYSSGRFFQLEEGKVAVVNPTQLENTLAWALENFNVTSEGFHFYYDLKANSIKHFIKSVSTELQNEILESSVNSHNEILQLNENLGELKSLRKSHKLLNHEAAIVEANEMISKVEQRIEELKKSATYVKYSYLAEDNKSYINNREVSTHSFAESAFATGHIDYGNKHLLNIFEIAAKNFHLYGRLKNIVEITEGNISMSVFRIADKGYTFRNNRDTKITELKEWSPIGAIDYIVERTGMDLSFMFDDLLESKRTLKNRIEEKLEETYELVSFLKSQKELLSSANKNIAEIKEADKLINSEIVKFEQIIKILEDDTLTKNDGYLDAKLLTSYQDAPEGITVKVDALDYTTAGKDDMITIIVNESPLKVIKKHIELDSKDGI
jgi:hypothetical protein